MTGIPSSSDESPARGAEPSEALAALPEHVAGRAGGGAAGGGAAGSLAFPSLAFPGPALAMFDTTLDEVASAASLRFAAAAEVDDGPAADASPVVLAGSAIFGRSTL